jgi:hypothetical protein
VRVVSIGVLALVCSLALGQDCAPVDLSYCDPLKVGGTFSDLHFDQTRQTAEGMEVRIVPAECGYQASVQFGQGQGSVSTWSRLILVDVHFTSDLWPLHVPWPALIPNEDTDDFWFTVPAGTAHAGEFYGVIRRDRLDGLFQTTDEGVVRVSLPRIAHPS